MTVTLWLAAITVANLIGLAGVLPVVRTLARAKYYVGGDPGRHRWDS